MLLVDEPSEGLAPVIVQRIRDILLQVKAQGSTVMLVEQNVKVASSARQDELLGYLGM